MTTKTLGDYYCSICGFLGQLKRRSEGIYGPYFYIDHYKGKKGLKTRLPLIRGSKYAYCCYLGMEGVLTEGYEILYPQPTLFALAQRKEHFLVIN